MATAQRKTAALSTTEFSVLGLLSHGEHSGYDLKKAAEAGVGYVWTAAKSHIYAVLPRLVEDGYATTRRVAQERRPDKQVYRITARGRRALKEWIEETPTASDPDRNPLLLKLFFGDHSSPEVLAEQVRERREAMEQLKAELNEIDARLGESERDFYSNLTRRYGHRYADAIIRWAKEVERDLAAQGEQ